MAASPFVDYVKIYLRSGAGGKGVVAWRREKFVPKGGPDGGDGGDGGSIYVKANPQLWTLLDLKYRKFVVAEDGGAGQGSKKAGKDGKDLILEVPLGTVVIDAETEEVIGEVKEKDDTLLLAKGGRGGRGNWHFRTSTNQTPDYAEPGGENHERAVVLELKVLADVGLVGFPNAGKSTLLSVMTAAKPKIADYAFTTLVPNLGIVKYREIGSFVMADIPGIIEGAHEGRGLGIQFLRHIERNSVLLFLISAESEDIFKDYKVLLGELEAYSPELMDKQRLVAITKMDLAVDFDLAKWKRKFKKVPLIPISSITGDGINTLKDALWISIEGEKTLTES
jgi:GTP-binding protein